LHVLATDGCFYTDAAFRVCSPPDTGALEKLFRYEVFKMLKAEGKIYDKSSSPSADDYIIDADYPIETYR